MSRTTYQSINLYFKTIVFKALELVGLFNKGSNMLMAHLTIYLKPKIYTIGNLTKLHAYSYILRVNLIGIMNKENLLI